MKKVKRTEWVRETDLKWRWGREVLWLFHGLSLQRAWVTFRSCYRADQRCCHSNIHTQTRSQILKQVHLFKCAVILKWMWSVGLITTKLWAVVFIGLYLCELCMTVSQRMCLFALFSLTLSHSHKNTFCLYMHASGKSFTLSLIRSWTTGNSHPAIPANPQLNSTKTGQIWFTAFCPIQKTFVYVSESVCG